MSCLNSVGRRPTRWSCFSIGLAGQSENDKALGWFAAFHTESAPYAEPANAEHAPWAREHAESLNGREGMASAYRYHHGPWLIGGSNGPAPHGTPSPAATGLALVVLTVTR